MTNRLSYKRIVLKISGEALSEKNQLGVSPTRLKKISQTIKHAAETGVQIAIVLGAGNFVRGETLIKQIQMPETKAHYTGMLATVMNALILEQSLQQLGCKSALLTAFNCHPLAIPYQAEKAIDLLEKQHIVLLAGGTGNPFFTTDTAASLRACEIKADVVIKATKVDGVYDKDPNLYDQAKKFDSLSYQDILEKGLKVMDLTAVSLCKEKNKPMVVFNMENGDHLTDIIRGIPRGTIVRGE